ncbi:MAG: hypothetical protein H6657_10585 [Ardenticatenaceae bacterium]|nr:hypothetical protein [Ardenticatenaceae bacterium]
MAFKQMLFGLLFGSLILLGLVTASWQRPLFAKEMGAADPLLYLPLISNPIDYRVELYPSAQNIEEYRLFCGKQHFLSVITQNGTFNLRPHPGEDINGWGSSLYLQPFFPNASLKHTTAPTITVTGNNIQIQAEGFVSLNADETYGSWLVSLALSCQPYNKQVSGSGIYQISLDGLMAPHGDLNLYRIASNYLIDVPLLSGGNGNTGDMATVWYAYDGSANHQWTPTLINNAHFPNDEADQLMVEVEGACNEVDTAAQGYAPIVAAAKPSLKLTLTSQNPDAGVRFGAFYDTSKSQDFWEDNVGITPLVNVNSPNTDFAFNVEFMSTSVISDGQIPCWGP